MSVLKRCLLWYVDHILCGPFVGMFFGMVLGCHLGARLAGWDPDLPRKQLNWLRRTKRILLSPLVIVGALLGIIAGFFVGIAFGAKRGLQGLGLIPTDSPPNPPPNEKSEGISTDTAGRGRE